MFVFFFFFCTEEQRQGTQFNQRCIKNNYSLYYAVIFLCGLFTGTWLRGASASPDEGFRIRITATVRFDIRSYEMKFILTSRGIFCFFCFWSKTPTERSLIFCRSRSSSLEQPVNEETRTGTNISSHNKMAVYRFLCGILLLSLTSGRTEWHIILEDNDLAIHHNETFAGVLGMLWLLTRKIQQFYNRKDSSISSYNANFQHIFLPIDPQISSHSKINLFADKKENAHRSLMQHSVSESSINVNWRTNATINRDSRTYRCAL